MPRSIFSINKQKAFLILLAATFFVGKTVYDIRSDRTLTIDAARTHSQGLASALNEHAVRAFSDAETSVNSIMPLVGAKHADLMPDKPSLHRTLKILDENSELTTSCFIVQENGHLYAASRQYPVFPVDLSSTLFFRHHLYSVSEGPYISPPFTDPLTNRQVITVTKRVSNRDGTLRAIVGVSIDPLYFSGFYRTTGLGKQDRVTLIHRNGAVLAHEPVSAKTTSMNFSNSQLFRAELPRSPLAGTFLIANGLIDDSRRIVSYRTSPRYPVIAMISLREEDVLEQWRKRALTTTGGATFFVLLVTTLGLMIYRQMDALERANEALTRKEEALRTSERRFRELLKKINLVAVILDVEGRIVFCNDSLLSLAGRNGENVAGKDWFATFMPEEEKDTVRSVFLEGVTKGEIPGHFENAIVSHDGTRRVIVWDNIVLHNPDNSVAGTASIGIDVTDHRQLEEQLRQSQKLEALGKLAGGVAHDFNNILSVITGYAHLLQMKMDETDPNGTVVRHISHAAERAAGLTKSLLAFSREQLITPQKLDIHEMIRRLLPFFQGLAGSSVSVKTLLMEQALYVAGDSVQMEQILMNLVSNAKDAMPDGGVLTIGTDLQDVTPALRHAHGCDSAARFAVVSVSDTGVGMKKELVRRVFEPFYTTKGVGKGTGLGLAMVYGMVKAHSGFIQINSQPAEGTTLKVFLPVFEKRGEQVPPSTVS